MITTFILGGYSLIFSLVFLKYLQRFIQDPTTANSDRDSWTVLILASILWPISLPLSALERNVQKTKYSFHYSEAQVDLIYLDHQHKDYSEFSSDQTEQEKIEV